MAELKERFPNDLDYAVVFDTTLPVSEGIKETLTTLLEAMVLVIIVVFLFLQNWRATLIPVIAVPVSLIGTFALFPLLGFWINTLSLFAFVLAIGLVVDDAIIVVEAVEHHIEEGKVSARGDDPGDEGSRRTRYRDRADLVGCFSAGRFYGRHSRATEQSVCDDHRDLDDHLGVQCVDAFACAGGVVVEAAKEIARDTRSLLRLVQSRLRQSHARISQLEPCTTAQSRDRVVIIVGFTLVSLYWSHAADEFSSRRRLRLRMLHVQLPPAASLERTDEVLKKVETILATPKACSTTPASAASVC